MSRTNNAIKNVSYNIGYQLLMLVMGFINRTLFLYFLNVEYLGVQAIFNDILQLLSMADLGLTTAMTYSFYKPLAKQDFQYISGLVNFYKRVCHLIALTISLIGISLIPFLPHLVNLTTDMPYLTLYYLLYLLNTVSSYLFVYKTVILAADQKGYITAKYGSIFNILQNITLALFLWLTKDFIAYLITQVVFTFLYNFTVSFVASKQYPYINQPITLPKKESQGIFQNIKSVFIYKISNVLISATDNILISIIVGTATVGYYSNYMLVVSKVISLITTAFNSLVSSLGNLVVLEGDAKRYEVFEMIQTACNMLSIFVVNIMLFLLQDFIGLWLGDTYLLDFPVLYAIVLNFYFSISLLPVWIYREATGLFNQIKYVMLITAILNLILSAILGNLFGLAGILLATSIARLLTYFWYEPILLFNQFFGHSSRSYFQSILKSVLVLGILILLSTLITRPFVVTSFITLLIKGLILSLLSGALILLFYYRHSSFQQLINRIRLKLK